MSITPLRDLIDQARPELEPLNPHYMAVREPIAKDRYLTLLAASLLEEGGLSEAQSRVFGMLAAAMAVNKPFSFFVQQVEKLDKTELKEIVEQLTLDDKACNAYIFDLMVLLRIDCALSNKQVWKLSQQSSLLFVSNERMQRIVFWCMLMLTGNMGFIKEHDLSIKVVADRIKSGFVSEVKKYNAIENIPYAIADIRRASEFYISYNCEDNNPHGSGLLSVSIASIASISGKKVISKVSHPMGIVVGKFNFSNAEERNFLKVNDVNKLVVMEVIPFLDEFKAWLPMFDVKGDN